MSSLLKGFCVWLLIGTFHPGNAQNITEIRVTAVEDPPFLIKDEFLGSPRYSGFVPDLLAAMGRSGLQFKLQLQPDDTYGSPLPNGTWTGMMGELTQDKADMALLLTVTANRLDAVDFTVPIMTSEPVIVLERPHIVLSWREKLSRLLAPVEFTVWLILTLAFVVTSVVLYIACSLNPYEWRALGKRNGATIREVESFTCMNTFWFVISTLFWQGFVRAPRSLGARVISTAWFFFVIIFVLTYTASLINYLQMGPEPSVARGYSSLDTFEELSEKDDVVVGMPSGGATEQFFKTADPDSIPGKIYKHAEQFMKDHSLSSAQGVALLTDRPDKTKSFAFIMESPSANYIVSKRCDLYMVTDSPLRRYLSIGVQKNSSLFETINSAVLDLQQDSTIAHIEAKWFRDTTCLRSSKPAPGKETYTASAFYPIDMMTISGAILLLIAGLVLGVIVTLFEWCAFKCRTQESSGEWNILQDPDSGNHVTVGETLPLDDEYMARSPKNKPKSKANGLSAASTQV